MTLDQEELKENLIRRLIDLAGALWLMDDNDSGRTERAVAVFNLTAGSQYRAAYENGVLSFVRRDRYGS